MNTQTDQSREPFVQLSEPWPDGWRATTIRLDTEFYADHSAEQLTVEVRNSDDQGRHARGEWLLRHDSRDLARGIVICVALHVDEEISLDALIAALTADIEHVLTDGGTNA